jgi:hypothetical protein
MRALSIVLLALSLIGCDAIARLRMSSAERAGSDLRAALAPRAEGSLAALASLDLPDGVATDPARDDLRLLVSPSAIALDELPPVQARFAAAGDAFAEGHDVATLVPPAIARVISLDAGRVPEPDSGAPGFLIEPLCTALTAEMSAERDAAAREEREPSHRIAIAVDRSVPYPTVARIVYSAAQSQYDTVSFLVRDGGIDVDLPRVGDPVVVALGARSAGRAEEALAAVDALLTGAAPPPAPPEPPPAAELVAGTADAPLVLTFVVQADGVHVSADRPLQPGCRIADANAAVTVPRVDGALDRGGLDACAAALAPLVRAHALVMVTGTHDTPFAEIAEVIAALRGPAAAPRIAHVSLGASLD